MVGLCMPSMALMLNNEPTIMAPVFPALMKASVSPLARYPKPTAMEESCFSRNALVGCSCMSIICLGEDNSKIIEAFTGVVDTIVEAKSAFEAVSYGYRLARKDETVLLSPACASFDLFENYEERGNMFKQAVRGL